MREIVTSMKEVDLMEDGGVCSDGGKAVKVEMLCDESLMEMREVVASGGD